MLGKGGMDDTEREDPCLVEFQVVCGVLGHLEDFQDLEERG